MFYDNPLMNEQGYGGMSLGSLMAAYKPMPGGPQPFNPMQRTGGPARLPQGRMGQPMMQQPRPLTLGSLYGGMQPMGRGSGYGNFGRF